VSEKSTRYGEDDEHRKVARVECWVSDDEEEDERKNEWVGNMEMSLQDGRSFALARFGLGSARRAQPKIPEPQSRAVVLLSRVKWRLNVLNPKTGYELSLGATPGEVQCCNGRLGYAIRTVNYDRWRFRGESPNTHSFFSESSRFSNIIMLE
jgi:hypothetical protein